MSSFEGKIKRKKAVGSRAMRACVLTTSEYKKKEFTKLLGQEYGVTLTFRDPKDSISSILEETDPSPHFILREESCLIDCLTQKVVDGASILKDPENAPLFLVHRSQLKVWKPFWKEDYLEDVRSFEYESSIVGRIDPTLKDVHNKNVFGWDHMFVNPRTGRSNQEALESKWSKTSARQLTLSDFVGAHLFYDHPQALSHYDQLKPSKAVEFSHEMSVLNFVQSNKYFTNPNINYWHTDQMLGFALSQGTFFKSSTSRPIKNFFSPPFGGVPLTKKKDPIEETIFMAHDMGHHFIPDLIVTFDGEDRSSQDHRFVYNAWRMISEAVTMIFADMFYADTLARTDSDYEKCADRRIYGLWKVLDLQKNLSDDADKLKLMKSVWRANVEYALLGELSGFNEMLPKEEGKRKDAEKALEFFRNHFEKFFIGDHKWTVKNYQNIIDPKAAYLTWATSVGPELFSRCHVFLLSGVVAELRSAKADLSSFSSTVFAVFEYLFERQLVPAFNYDLASLPSEDILLGKAFLRYMVGCLSFYPRFFDLAGMPERFESLKKAIEVSDLADSDVRKKIVNQYHQDVCYTWSMGCISAAIAANCCSLSSIFPPFYIKYSYDEYNTVRDAVQDLQRKK